MSTFTFEFEQDLISTFYFIFYFPFQHLKVVHHILKNYKDNFRYFKENLDQGGDDSSNTLTQEMNNNNTKSDNCFNNRSNNKQIGGNSKNNTQLEHHEDRLDEDIPEKFVCKICFFFYKDKQSIINHLVYKHRIRSNVNPFFVVEKSG